MYRVTKPNCYFVICTYGRPEERNNILYEALQGVKFEMEAKQVSLSLMSNLINILRNNSSDFSVQKAIKDKNVLVPSIFEAVLSKLKQEKDELKNKIENVLEENEDKINFTNNLEKLNKKIMQTTLTKIMYERKLEKENEIKNEVSNKSEVEVELQKKQEIIQEKIEDLNLDKEELVETKDNELNNKLNDARRSHCYLYIFKKLCN